MAEPRSTLSPQELEWHERVRDALNSKIENPNFFVWIDVTAEPGAVLDEEELRGDVEEWLGGLDADGVIEVRSSPVHEYSTGGLSVVLRALPKKPEARGRSTLIVGNPVPAFAYWVSG
jgi:hypothetical protein